jgi:hypothetical protein
MTAELDYWLLVTAGGIMTAELNYWSLVTARVVEGGFHYTLTDQNRTIL